MIIIFLKYNSRHSLEAFFKFLRIYKVYMYFPNILIIGEIIRNNAIINNIQQKENIILKNIGARLYRYVAGPSIIILKISLLVL